MATNRSGWSFADGSSDDSDVSGIELGANRFLLAIAATGGATILQFTHRRRAIGGKVVDLGIANGTNGIDAHMANFVPLVTKCVSDLPSTIAVVGRVGRALELDWTNSCSRFSIIKQHASVLFFPDRASDTNQAVCVANGSGGGGQFCLSPNCNCDISETELV